MARSGVYSTTPRTLFFQLGTRTHANHCRKTLVRFRSIQIWCNGEEETALAVYWVMDGIDRCRVGFLPRHLLKHKTGTNC